MIRFILAGMSFILLSSASFADTLTLQQRDTLIDSLSDALFLKVRLEQSLTDAKYKKLHYELAKKVFEKAAVSEFEVEQALWQWERTEILSQYVAALLRIKEAEIKLNENPFTNPKQLEPFYRERWEGRLVAARAELKRAERDQAFYSYWTKKNEILVEKAAVSREEFHRVLNLAEGALRELTQIQAALVGLEKSVYLK